MLEGRKEMIEMKRQLRSVSLIVCGVAAVVALMAVAATAANPLKTYIGQTDWQRAQQKMREQDWKSGRVASRWPRCSR